MIKWSLKPWDELTKDELYSITQLRIEVFVIEQNCPYQDLDGNDQYSHHVIGVDSNNEIVAYSRIVAAGKTYPEVSIGRVVIKESSRGQQLGVLLMKKAVENVKEIYGEVKIHISAQEHLENYYNSVGFVKTTEMYLEDNIPHIGMDFTWENQTIIK